MEHKSKVGKFLKSKMFTLLILLAIIVIFFTVMSGGGYLKLRNIKNILTAMSVVAFLTVGASCLLISGQIDLSAGAVGTLAAIVYAIFSTNLGWPWFIAVIIALVVAALLGIMNAAFINELGFQGFITTLATTSVCTGLAMILTNSVPIKVRDKAIIYIGSGKWLNDLLPVAVVLAVLFFVAYGVMLKKTRFGRAIYLVGGNPHAARLAGLNPKKVSYILFANSSVLGAVAAILLAGRLKSAGHNGIISSQFAGVTAAILGGVSFGGGTGGMAGAFVGLLILNAFNNGMSVIEGIDPYWQTVASGALLLVALMFDYISIRGGKSRPKRAASK